MKWLKYSVSFTSSPPGILISVFFVIFSLSLFHTHRVTSGSHEEVYYHLFTNPQGERHVTALIQHSNGEQSEKNDILGLSPMEFAILSSLTLSSVVIIISKINNFIREYKFRNMLHYEIVRYIWNFTSKGDFDGIYIYTVHNRSAEYIYSLPSESLIWYRMPKNREVNFKINKRDGLVLQDFGDNIVEWNENENTQIGIKYEKEFSVSWRPKILSPLGPGEKLEYQVYINTPGTETDAFSEKGSTLGFPVSHPTDQVELIARAPHGFRFDFIEPKYLIVELDSGKIIATDENVLEKPEIIGGGEVLRWIVKSPLLGKRHIISYKFTKILDP